ncbi:hypothetical protein UFOVP257_169 [uncultured Caudovirales phage]|uniref:Uncharacterized protein n=1 Tax=uncultured Caudovirales phage TaxID=2100421 RepID=A0A6J5LGQ0_9CAUD|nr:hypothetical protein UFOVP257_169 [uncultured Caudovirales phage]
MKITDIIRNVLDIIDHAEDPEPPAVAVVQIQDSGEELGDIQRLAGLTSQEPEYANEPNEIIASMGAAFPAGDDVHHSKNPADIRTNAPSMYPGFQARM